MEGIAFRHGNTSVHPTLSHEGMLNELGKSDPVRAQQ